MKRVAVVSPKGGVGKTTVTVNLSVALHRAGHQVMVVDLDPQSALRFHFNLDLEHPGGLSRAAIDGTPWRDACVQSESGVVVLPFGEVGESEREQIELAIHHDPDWLLRHLQAMGLSQDAIVLLDTPPGASVYLRQALQVAHAALVVALPDAGSYATLPGMERLLQTYCAGRPDFVGSGYVINQMDASRQLARDVAGVLRQDLGERLAAVVHQDASVGEAVAFRRSIFDYAPHSLAAQDFATCVQWLQARFDTGTARADPSAHSA